LDSPFFFELGLVKYSRFWKSRCDERLKRKRGQMTQESVYIACDHAGFDLKCKVLNHYKGRIQFEDLGCHSKERCDYPDYAEALARRVSESKDSRGILICGTGIGMSIAANKVSGVRAALCENPVSARLTKEHNGSNVLCLGSRIVGEALTYGIIDAWLNAQQSREARHQARVEKINELDKRS
jgi:ribose 5-phosphate isomerase B